MPTLRQQLTRFAVVGGLASLAHVVIGLWSATKLGLPVLVANMLAFSVAVLVSYVGNHAWTFGRSGFHGWHFPRFFAVAAIGLGLNQLIILLTVTLGGLPYLYGLLLVIAIVPGLTFVLSRYWAFMRHEEIAGSA